MQTQLSVTPLHTAVQIDIDRDLVWIAMVGMAEPSRMGVRHLIQDLNRAGIDGE